jgi:hypothetical protein
MEARRNPQVLRAASVFEKAGGVGAAGMGPYAAEII